MRIAFRCTCRTAGLPHHAGQPEAHRRSSASLPCVALSAEDLTRARRYREPLPRPREHSRGTSDEILAMKPPPSAVWMQLGIHHGPSARRCARRASRSFRIAASWSTIDACSEAEARGVAFGGLQGTIR